MIRDDPNWHQDGAGRGNLGWSPFVKQGDSHFRGQRFEEDSQLCHPLHLFLPYHLLEMLLLLLLSSLVTMMARTGFLGRRRRRLSASILRGHNPRILRHGLNSEPRGQNLEIPSIANAALPPYGTIVALKHCSHHIIRVSRYRKTSISKLAGVGLNI